jgi:hypothetical protein
MNKDYKDQVTGINSLKIWLIFFVYTVIVSCFIQFFVLKFIFPHWNDGNGLLISSLDSKNFHSIAVELANRIRLDGWSAWELRPNGQAPAGIAAVFYFLLFPKPWVLIPLNAALHASAAFILWRILNLFLKDQKKSLICVLPFLIFPSNLQWTAQLHKDGFSILGSALILYSLVILVKLENLKSKNWYLSILFSFILYMAGIFLIWIVRPFMLMIIKFVMAPLFPLLVIAFLVYWFRRILTWQRILAVLGTFLTTFFILSQVGVIYRTPHFKEYDLIVLRSEKWLGTFAGSNNLSTLEKEGLITMVAEEPELSPKPSQVVEVREVIKEPELSPKPSRVTGVEEKEPKLFQSVSLSRKINKPKTKSIKVEPKKVTQKYIAEYNWKKTTGLPIFIESKAYALAQMRGGFRFTAPEAKSNIDHDIGFGCFQDMLNYLPRATQIVFLAPFPNQWFSQGSTAANSFMRRISAFEMMVIYFSLIFLPFAIWYWRKHLEFWIIFIFCFSMMLVYGLVICNIGTLYRMRYGYITTFAALGIAGFIILLEKLKIKCAE